MAGLNGFGTNRVMGFNRPQLSNNSNLSDYQVGELVANAIWQRNEFFRSYQDRRNLDEECGYPESTVAIDPYFYRYLYDRESIATRVVQVLPDESWQVQPEVYDDENASTATEFEKAWDTISKSLRGDKSYYKSEEGSLVWDYLKRADRLSRIGRFGVLLLGIDDDRPLNVPIDGFSEGLPGVTTELFAGAVGTDAQYLGQTFSPPNNQQSSVYGAAGFYGGAGAGGASLVKTGRFQGTYGKKSKQRKLLFMRAFDESLVQIVQYEANIRNPRFGQPVMYRITLNDPREQHSGVGLPLATLMVHWSRVIHIADNLGSSEIFGVPAMQQPLNRIIDLQKLYGGSAEMYWRGAFPGIAFETNPALGGEVQIDQDKVGEAMFRYYSGLQRYLTAEAMSVKTISPQYVDPTAQIDAALTAICIMLNIPKRIFMGSERGELSSGQDDGTWKARLRTRQMMYLTPRIIVPFVDRLIAIGVLPEPKNDGYTVAWPGMENHTAAEKAKLALDRTQAMSGYVGGGVDVLMDPADYLTRELDYTEEEAEEILENASEHLTEVHPEMDEENAIPGREPKQPQEMKEQQQQEQQQKNFGKQMDQQQDQQQQEMQLKQTALAVKQDSKKKPIKPVANIDDKHDEKGRFAKKDSSDIDDDIKLAKEMDSLTEQFGGHGWQDKLGTFYANPEGGIHIDFSEKFFGINEASLKSKGWMRISPMDDVSRPGEDYTLYVNNPSPPNTRQKKALIDWATEHKYANIQWDNDKTLRTLWERGVDNSLGSVSNAFDPEEARNPKGSEGGGRWTSNKPVTETEAFKKWFGDSKIVDESGNPLMVFHGTSTKEEFYEFEGKNRKDEMLSFGIHFSADPELADAYAADPTVARRKTEGRIIPVYLRANNLLDGDQIVYEGSKEYALAKKLAGSRFQTQTRVNDEGKSEKGCYLQYWMDATNGKRAAKIIQEAGYDGVKYKAKLGRRVIGGMQVTKESTSYLVFSKNQIKSATGNKGTFDNSGNVANALGGLTPDKYGYVNV